jgi:DNA-binding transcriptional LysR family regulator
VFFTERRNTELAHYEGTNPPSANKNAAARKVWWGVRAAPSPGSSTTSPQATTRADNVAAALDAAQDGWVIVLLAVFLVGAGTPRAGDIAIGSPPTAPSTRLLCPKELGSSDASSAWVKKEADTPASFTRVKKEPGMTPASRRSPASRLGKPTPSSKKARRLAEDAVLQLEY